MDAVSHIQAGMVAAVVPKVSMPEGHGAGTGVFREAMRQALEPERSTAKVPERLAPASAPPTHVASASRRTARSGAPQVLETDSISAAPDATDPVSVSTRALAVCDVNVSSSGAPGSGNTQSLADEETVTAMRPDESPGGVVSDRSVQGGPDAVAESSAPASKDSRVSPSKNAKLLDDGSPAPSATVSPAIATGVSIAPLPMLPTAQLSFGAGTSQSATATEDSAAGHSFAHGILHTLEPAPGVLLKQSDSASSKLDVPSASLDPAGETHSASASSANSAGAAVAFDPSPSDLTTTTSSSDLLLSAPDSAQVSPTSGSLKNAFASGAALNDSPAGTVTSTGAPSRASDLPLGIQDVASGASIASVSATSRGGPTGQGEPSAAAQPPAPVGAQFGSTVGNIAGAHPGTSAAMSIGRPGLRNSEPSMMPSATFTAMDRAEASPRGVLLRASSNQVAVGVSDPGLGWIEVRAERIGGQLAAALTTSSAASHAELTAVLPAMSSYLNDHHQAVQQIQVEASLSSGQNATGSQGHSGSQQHRGTPAAEPLAAISGIGDRSKANAMQQTSTAETMPQRMKVHGHQFSVRA